MPRRVDADHHRPVDARGIPPGVDHRGAGALALAQQVDGAVTERHPRGLHVVHLLRQAVAGQIDTFARQSLRARPEGAGVCVEGFRAEKVGRVAERRRNLWAVQHGGAVHPPVADHDDVVTVGEPARLRELHVREARTAAEAKDRLRGMIRSCADADHRQGDEPRVRIGPVLGHGKRSAVGCEVAILGGVYAPPEAQVAGLRSCGHGDSGRVRGNTQIHQAPGQDCDES
jgi:hypothetical protein